MVCHLFEGGNELDVASHDQAQSPSRAIMLDMIKSRSIVVLLSSDLRPITLGINRELASYGAEPVQKEELPEIDRMLHEGLGVARSETGRCSHCRGYASIGADGDLTCLNCGRSGTPPRQLDEVTHELSKRLLDRRVEQSRRTASEA